MVDFHNYPLMKPHPINHRSGVAFAALATPLPPAPASVHWYQRVEAAGGGGMLCNDRIGDCAEAAQLHSTMLRTAYAGSPLVASNADAMALYSAVTGYDPATPGTDPGTQLSDLMAYAAGDQIGDCRDGLRYDRRAIASRLGKLGDLGCSGW